MPNGEATSTFSSGLNKDLSKSVQPNNTYLNAKNLRLITLSGQSNFTIENVRGNTLSNSLFDTSIVYRVEGSTGYGTTPTENYTITINGTNILNTGNIVTGLKNLAAAFNANSSYSSVGYVAHLSTDQTELYITATESTPITSLTISLASGHTVDIFTHVPAQANLIPIGFTTIRDDIYIFSTNNETANPGGVDSSLPTDPVSYGQIWKLTYDKSTYVSDLTLIYNAQINFTTQHPIPPTAVEGRYETPSIQRLYWSDNFNPPRNINVVGDNLFSLDSSLIDSQPELDLSIPILQKINYNGNLLVGVYQAAYRLKKNGGATSDFSQLSNQVYIVNDINEADAVGGDEFQTYISDNQGTQSNKSITWQINNLDTDFDRIELAVVFRDALNGTPIVAIVNDEPIDSTGSTTITYTGNETNLITITLEELIVSSPYINKVKTLATKDNRLFYGNVSIASKSLEEFDTRAYRFDSAGNANILNNDIPISYTGATLIASNNVLEETNDSINNDTATNVYPYPFPGVGHFGGTGYNISYEIGVYVIPADTTVEIDVDGDGIQTAPYRVNYSPAESSVNLGVVGQDYPLNSRNDYMGSPYLASIFKSCKRGETYRWAIQFFDKAGAPFFTKWVGDIKMPEMWQACASTNRYNRDGSLNTDAGAPTDFRTSYIETVGNVAKLQIPFIKFTVRNLNAIADQIGGYSFVRVERKEEDKTILGQGLVHMTFRYNATNLYLPSLNTYASMNVSSPVNGANTQTNTGTVQIPEFLFNGFPGFETGDVLKVLGYNTPANSTHNISPDATNPNSYTIEKMYNMTLSPIEYDIDESFEIGFAQSATINTYGTYHNFDPFEVLGLPIASSTVGSKTLYFKLDSTLDYASILTANARSRFLVEYKRVVTAQYGGNTYSDRASNSYIFAGHFQPTNDQSTTITNDVFGGDIFTNVYDCQRGIKNWSIDISGRLPGGTKQSLTDYFAVETTVGTEWRSGIHVNRNLIVDAATDPEINAYFETFDYNNVLDSEPNLRFYNPQPESFTDVTGFDNRFYASEIKINGEGGDSWTIFRPNNYWDVEGTYGPINAMTILKDKMFFFQDRSFGILMINPIALINDTNGTELTLGIGEIIQRHDYLSTKVGCKHQWGITKSSNSLFFFDINTKKLYKFDQALTQLSDIKGMASYFYNNLDGKINVTDNPIYNSPTLGINGITCVYDFRFNEAIFTFLDNTNKFTVAFNEQVNAFTGFYDYTPGLYITDGNQIFSPSSNNLEDLYLHEHGDYSKFYGTIFPSSLSFIVNEYPKETKIFDNFEWITEVIALADNGNEVNIFDETWKEVRVYNDYQNSDYILLDPLSLSPNIKRRDRTWRLALPRNRVLYTNSNSPDIFTDLSLTNKLFPERIRDKYLTVDLSYDNLNNYCLKLHSVSTLYRISNR